MVAPVPTAEVLLISRHPRRSLDLRRLGLDVRQEDPAVLSDAPVLGAEGIVIIDALDGDSAAGDLLATVGRHVENAAVVVLLDEETSAPATLGTRMRILRSPIRGQDVATTIHELAEAQAVEAQAPADPQPAEPSPVAAPHVASPAAAPPVPPPAAAPPVPPPAAAPPVPPPAPEPAPPAQRVPPVPAQEAPHAKERRFGRRRRMMDDAPSKDAHTQAHTQAPTPLDWSAHAEAVLAGLHARPTWKEVALGLAEDAAPVLGPDAAVLVREPDGTWPVAAGVGLRPIEFGMVVDDDHTLVGLGTKQHPVAVVPDTDLIRSDLVGAPLSSRRCLLVALVFPLPVLLVTGRSERPFDKADVKTAVGLVERWRWPLASALQRRDLARALQRFA